jgi:hypothetical protein
VPLDASLKQYAYTQGMDLKTAVPLDAQGLIEQIRQGATVNDQGGWLTPWKTKNRGDLIPRGGYKQNKHPSIRKGASL